MNKLIFLTAGFLMFIIYGSPNYSSPNTIINGNILNPVEKEILLYFHDPATPNVDPVIKTVPVINGSFSHEAEILEPTYMTFRVANLNFSVFLEPGDQLQINFDRGAFLEPLDFEGKGSANNKYLIDFKNKFFPAYFDFPNFIKGKGAQEFKNYFGKQREDQMAFYKLREKELSPTFKRLAKGGIESYYAVNILKYPGFYYPGTSKTFNGLPTDLPANFYDGIKKEVMQNDYLLTLTNYREHIIAFVELNHKKMKVQGESYDLEEIVEDKMQIVRENFTGSTRDFLIAAYLMNLVTEVSLEKAISEYEDIKLEVINKDVLIPVEKAIAKFQSVLPGEPAPQFELQDLNGNRVSLTDFKGKIVYVDFWASWCVPCLAEVPSAEKLKEYYKQNDDVVFLYISLDDKEQDWRNIIKSKDLKGLHILSLGWKSEVADKYNISSIPRYFLIDKNGRIANQNAPRPSDEGIITEIDRVLKIP